MSNLTKDIEDATKLYHLILKAQKEFNNDVFREQIKESEISFRYDVVRGFLIMARNEAFQMLHEWKSDLIPESKESSQ